MRTDRLAGRRQSHSFAVAQSEQSRCSPGFGFVRGCDLPATRYSFFFAYPGPRPGSYSAPQASRNPRQIKHLCFAPRSRRIRMSFPCWSVCLPMPSLRTSLPALVSGGHPWADITSHVLALPRRAAMPAFALAPR